MMNLNTQLDTQMGAAEQREQARHSATRSSKRRYWRNSSS